MQNFGAKATGQLSIITYGLNTAGAAARIFTSIQEKAGDAMLRGAVISECPTLLFWHQTPMLLATLLLASLRLPPLPWHTPSSAQPHAAPSSGSLQTCPLV